MFGFFMSAESSRVRFSIRSLVLATTVIGTVFGLLGNNCHLVVVYLVSVFGSVAVGVSVGIDTDRSRAGFMDGMSWGALFGSFLMPVLHILYYIFNPLP